MGSTKVTESVFQYGVDTAVESPWEVYTSEHAAAVIVCSLERINTKVATVARCIACGHGIDSFEEFVLTPGSCFPLLTGRIHYHTPSLNSKTLEFWHAIQIFNSIYIRGSICKLPGC